MVRFGMENNSESRERGSKKGGPLFESGIGFDTGFFVVSMVVES